MTLTKLLILGVPSLAVLLILMPEVCRLMKLPPPYEGIKERWRRIRASF